MSRILTIVTLIFSSYAWADDISYRADVDGMVCAFCAYNVSKNISKLPGIYVDSVNVDLQGGHVVFQSSQTVDEFKLAALFSESGFTISNLNKTGLKDNFSKSDNVTPLLELEINQTKTEQYNSVLEAVGNIAASTPSRLLIKAALSEESKLLKPLLVGRQKVIKVRFVPVESETISIQLFEDSSNQFTRR